MFNLQKAEMKERALEKYNEVYDETKKEFRCCGRAKCLELIEICQQYADMIDFPNHDFGDSYGKVNLMNVQKLLEKF